MLKLKRYPSRSPYWYVRGTVAGVELFESTGTTDRAEAERYRRKRDRETYDRVALGETPPATFEQAVDAFEKTGRETRFLLPLLDHFKDTPLNKLGQGEIDAAAVALYPDAKASTLNRQVYGPMIAVLRHAAKARMPGAAPPMIEMRKIVKPLVKPAGDGHIDKVLPHCPPGLQALLLLMTYTGLRTGEALRVKPEDIEDDYVLVGKTKNNQPRRIPIPVGWSYPEGGWGFTTTQGVGRALRKASVAAGVEYKDGHEIGRHTFAARWLKSGRSLKGLKDAGGWKKLAIVDEIYGHLEQTEIHEQMRELSRARAKSVQKTAGSEQAEGAKQLKSRKKKGRKVSPPAAQV